MNKIRYQGLFSSTPGYLFPNKRIVNTESLKMFTGSFKDVITGNLLYNSLMTHDGYLPAQSV